MKKLCTYLLFSAMFLMAQISWAQEDEPRFPGCDDPADVDCADMKMMQFVFSNLKHPDGNPGGEVVASFMVKSSGDITSAKVIESLSPECDAEVLRIVNLMPSWLPALVDGAPTDMTWELVVKFTAK